MHAELAEGYCTDAFTTQTLTEQLRIAPMAYQLIVAALCFVALIVAVSTLAGSMIDQC